MGIEIRYCCDGCEKEVNHNGKGTWYELNIDRNDRQGNTRLLACCWTCVEKVVSDFRREDLEKDEK